MMHRVPTLLSGVALILAMTFSVRVLGQTPTTMEAIAQSYERRAQALHTGECEGIEEFTQTKSGKQSVISDMEAAHAPVSLQQQLKANNIRDEKRVSNFYSSFSPGKSLETDSSVLPNGYVLKSRIVSDGKDSYIVSVSPNGKQGANLNSGTKSTSWLYQTLFWSPVGGKGTEGGRGRSIGEVIKQHIFEYADTAQDSEYGQLVHFKRSQDGYQYGFWLSVKHDYMLVRATAIYPLAREDYQVKAVKQIEGVWVPMEVVNSNFETRDGIETLADTRTHLIKKMKFNAVNNAQFVSGLKAGDSVKDAATNQLWQIGQNGERMYEDITGKEPVSMIPGWLYMASVATLLVLTVLAYVRWKRKQWSRQD